MRELIQELCILAFAVISHQKSSEIGAIASLASLLDRAGALVSGILITDTEQLPEAAWEHSWLKVLRLYSEILFKRAAEKATDVIWTKRQNASIDDHKVLFSTSCKLSTTPAFGDLLSGNSEDVQAKIDPLIQVKISLLIPQITLRASTHPTTHPHTHTPTQGIPSM